MRSSSIESVEMCVLMLWTLRMSVFERTGGGGLSCWMFLVGAK